MDPLDLQDSPLSISANVAGILTFIVAIIAAIYARMTYLRNSDKEYTRIKAALSWYKTESTWLAELIRAMEHGPDPADRKRTEYEMCAFLMDDLVKLEDRLLELIADAEERAANNDSQWAPSWRNFGFVNAMAWLAVRTKALDLVRQREALTSRVQFTQMSMIALYVFSP
jgi:hypothetical protein